MRDVYFGSALIDDHYYIVQEDSRLRDMLQLDIYASCMECVYPLDQDRFLNCTTMLFQKEKEHDTIIVRLKDVEGLWSWFYVEMNREEIDSEKNRQMISVKFTDIMAMHTGSEELQLKNAEYYAYLDMLEAVLISYDCDEDYLKVYSSLDHRETIIFEGDLDNWKQRLTANKVAECSFQEVNKFCLALKEGRSATCEIMDNSFSEDRTYQNCIYKCMKLNAAQKNKMVGCVILKDSKADVSRLAGMEYTLDVGIPVLNKKSITEFAKKQIADPKVKQVVVAILDLDNFKAANDVYGHMMGDEVLNICGDIIKKAVGNQGMVGRIGGDELLIVLDVELDHSDLRNLFRTIRTDIEMTFREKIPKAPVTCTIGAAKYPQNGDDYNTIFKFADKVLYLAKEKGKNRYIIYNPELHGKMDGSEEEKSTFDGGEDVNVDKTRLMQEIVEIYLMKQHGPTYHVLSKIGSAFQLYEILFYSERRQTAFIWKEGQINYHVPEEDYFPVTEEFLQLFGNRHEKVVDGYYDLEGHCSEIQELLKRKNIPAVIFTQLTNAGKPCGYIMFAKGKNGRKWSEYDVTYLSTVGKILDMGDEKR